MLSSALQLKAALVCYAVLSFPYVTIALHIGSVAARGTFVENETAAGDATSSLSISRSTSADSIDPTFLFDRTTPVGNIPQDEQEIFYFRNFTMVGKKSDGFNITKWDEDHGHNTKALAVMTPGQRLDIGDATLKVVGAGLLVGAALLVACVLASPACATYVGQNIGLFWAGVGATGGAAAIESTRQVAAGAPSALENAVPATSRKGKRDYTLDEEFGCYSTDSNSAPCTDQDMATAAFTTIINNDGSDNPPNWSCYELSDDQGTIYGYYTHCFAQGDGVCDLQCGEGAPDITGNIYPVDPPTSR